MISRLLKDVVIYGLTSVLSKAIGLVLLPFYTRVLDPTAYGLLDIIGAFSAICGVLIPLEITQGIARYFPEKISAQKKIEYASSGLVFTMLSFASFALVLSLGRHPLSRLLFNAPGFSVPFLLGSVGIFISGLHYYVLNQVRWELKPAWFLASTVTQLCVVSSVSAIFILKFKLGVLGFLYGQISGTFCGCLVAFWAVRRSFKISAFRLGALEDLITFSFPFAISGLVWMLSTYLDRLCLSHLSDLSSVGRYGVAVRVASICSLVTQAFQLAFYPLIIHNYHREETPRTIAQIFNIYVVLAANTVLLLTVISKPVMTMLVGSKFQGVWPLIPPLAMAALTLSMPVFTPGLQIHKRTRLLSVIAICTVTANLILNLSLIRFLGIYGAAFASLGSSILNFGLFVIMSQPLYFIPFQLPRVLFYAFLMLLLGGASVFVHFLVAGPFLKFVMLLLIQCGGVIISFWLVPLSKIRVIFARIMPGLRKRLGFF